MTARKMWARRPATAAPGSRSPKRRSHGSHGVYNATAPSGGYVDDHRRKSAGMRPATTVDDSHGGHGSSPTRRHGWGVSDGAGAGAGAGSGASPRGVPTGGVGSVTYTVAVDVRSQRTGDPIAGAHVALLDGDSSDLVVANTTNDFGRAVVRVKARASVSPTWTLETVCDGFQPARRRVHARDRESHATVELVDADPSTPTDADAGPMGRYDHCMSSYGRVHAVTPSLCVCSRVELSVRCVDACSREAVPDVMCRIMDDDTFAVLSRAQADEDGMATIFLPSKYRDQVVVLKTSKSGYGEVEQCIVVGSQATPYVGVVVPPPPAGHLRAVLTWHPLPTALDMYLITDVGDVCGRSREVDGLGVSYDAGEGLVTPITITLPVEDASRQWYVPGHLVAHGLHAARPYTVGWHCNCRFRLAVCNVSNDTSFADGVPTVTTVNADVSAITYFPPTEPSSAQWWDVLAVQGESGKQVEANICRDEKPTPEAPIDPDQASNRFTLGCTVVDAASGDTIEGAAVTVSIMDEAVASGTSSSSGICKLRGEAFGWKRSKAIVSAALEGWVTVDQAVVLRKSGMSVRAVMSKPTADDELRCVLTWAHKPKDLDMNIVLPNNTRVNGTNTTSHGVEMERTTTKGFGPESVKLALGVANNW